MKTQVGSRVRDAASTSRECIQTQSDFHYATELKWYFEGVMHLHSMKATQLKSPQKSLRDSVLATRIYAGAIFFNSYSSERVPAAFVSGLRQKRKPIYPSPPISLLSLYGLFSIDLIGSGRLRPRPMFASSFCNLGSAPTRQSTEQYIEAR